MESVFKKPTLTDRERPDDELSIVIKPIPEEAPAKRETDPSVVAELRGIIAEQERKIAEQNGKIAEQGGMIGELRKRTEMLEKYFGYRSG